MQIPKGTDTLPLISVIVPVYNGEMITGDCIESILSQNYPKEKIEIFNVDNNSKDNTAKIIKRYPVRYILEDKIQSSYASRNAAIRIAKRERY